MNCSVVACVAHDLSVGNSPARIPRQENSAHCPSGRFARDKQPARNRCEAVPSRLIKCVLGGVLLSRTLAGAVPSALSGLASGFGMGPGVSLSL